jgi:outer membrane biosynthesis protein TonB
MNCRKCRAELERLLDSELVPGERAMVEQHLAACAECRQKLSELQALNSVLKARSAVEPEPDYLAGFNDRFWHEVKRRRRMQSVEPERRFLPAFWTRIGSVAAVALLLIAVGLVGYRSWHTFFESPSAVLPQPVPEAVPVPEASAKAIEPRPVSRAAEPRATEIQPPAEEAKPAAPVAASSPAPARTEPVLKSSPAPVTAPSVQPPGAQAQGKAEGGKGWGLAERILDALKTEVSVSSAESEAPSAGAKKGGLKTGEQKSEVKSGQAPGQEVGGIKTQAVDTVIYSEEKLGAKPVLVSIPDAGDDDRMKYPNMEVPVWVVIEKDGSVSRAESRATTANAGLERVALSLARQAQFNPGTRAGNVVRVGKIIVVKIKALKQKDD